MQSQMRQMVTSWVACVLVGWIAPVAQADLYMHVLYAEGSEPGVLHTAPLDDGWDGPGTGSASLTYYFGDLTADLPEATVKATLVAALEVWADVADITFTETKTPGLASSIDFEFATGDHGDGAPFSSGVLAHAFLPSTPKTEVPGFPEIAGDVHFNDAFTWEVGDTPGADSKFDLTYIAVHEIGHSLGLGHSSVAGNVMLPSVGDEVAFTALGADDKASILLAYDAAAVPEPSSFALGGLLAVGLARRRRRAG